MRHRDYYDAAIEKHAYNLAHGNVSARVEDGARAAILASFMPELVQDKRDSRRHFLEQIERIEALFGSIDQDTTVFMRATVEDYKEVLQNRRFGSIVLAGFGNISAIAVPLDRDEGNSSFTYLDWLHAAALADHAKLGEAILLQCGGLKRAFNPPWGIGVMSSPRNIISAVGQQRYATSDLPATPVTDQDALSYDQIYAQFQPDNYPQIINDGNNESRSHRLAQSLADAGLLSIENWERLRNARDAIDPRKVFAHKYPHTPDPIKIPYKGEYDPRNFPRL